MLNETHNPALSSGVVSANATSNDFPIQDLPFAVFHRQGSAESFRGGVAMGDPIVDLAALAQSGVLKGEAAVAAQVGAQDQLNALMALPRRQGVKSETIETGLLTRTETRP